LRGLGFGGAETHKDIPGATSPARFKSGAPIEFVVRLLRRAPIPSAIFISSHWTSVRITERFTYFASRHLDSRSEGRPSCKRSHLRWQKWDPIIFG
jgi:hypothetical protein